MQHSLKERLYIIIFGTGTPAGKWFDIALIFTILASVFAVLLDSIGYYHQRFGDRLLQIEWFFTLLFTIEYLVRLYCSPNPRAYASSFYGVVDFLAIVPTYLALLIPSANLLLVIRLMRVLRIFRVLKLFKYIGEANVLIRSLRMARRKILVFIFCVMVLVTLFGSLMYVIEGPEYGFTSIPLSIYWAIVTITTVGYGDIAPHTALGQIIAAIAMLTGYAILAIPTGILSAELITEIQREKRGTICINCDRGGHDVDAHFCKYCGTAFTEQ